MTDTDLSAQALDRLAPDRLVALLDGLDPADPALADLDINLIGQVVDPHSLGRDDFVRLLAALDRLAGLGADVDLALRSSSLSRALLRRVGWRRCLRHP